MLQWLLGLFKPAGASDKGQRASSDPADAEDSPPPFLRREAMLDRHRQTAAYLFSVETPAALQAHDWQAASRKFFDGVLIDHFLAGRMAGLLGRRLAFLPLSAAGLTHPRLAQLPRDNLVIEFAPPAGARFDPETVPARLAALREAGYQLALGHELERQGLAGTLEKAGFIILDRVSAMDPPDLLGRCHELAARYPGARLVARDIDSTELYQACENMGIHLFQGRFLFNRDTSPANRIAPYRMFVVELLNAIKRQADYGELAGLAWRDPALAYRLLRFVNSAAMGLREKIDRLRDALAYVGRDELYRWLTLLLFNSRKPGPLDEALRENALVRAKLAELLAQGRMTPKECDEAFVVGILSVIDALLEMPMADALAQINLPEPVAEALLRGEGKYAPYLKLALACEESDQATLAELAAALGMDALMVNQRHIDALGWAMRFSESLDTVMISDE